jgi:hypothetical protein
MRRRLFLSLTLAATVWPAAAQDVTLEYRVKAAYLYNFVKFVDWPAAARTGPLTLCVAGRNPFGDVLADTIRGESIDGRPLATRVVADADPSCPVVFIPGGVAAGPFLSAARGTPTLTVGETDSFLMQGGIIAFVADGRTVRFAISTDAAAQAKLTISSRLLRLAINAPRVPGR